MNYNEFVKKHVGKAMDYDGVAGVQCVDLAKYYLKEVFDINPGAWGDAHCYYDNFNNISALKSNFDRIPNTPNFVPKKGDIMVWSGSLNGGWGHIAVCTGEGNTTYFYSYDQNWHGNHDACAKIKHNYNHVLGVLRPKNQSKILGCESHTNPFVKGKNYTLTSNVKVRTGAGTKYSQKKTVELTSDAKKNALNQTVACLKSGTVVTVNEVKKISNKEYWGKIPSGWIALMYNGKKFVK
ncbi:MAG: CHAP domain-containing protein [Oscillospiraceae bacterium]